MYNKEELEKKATLTVLRNNAWTRVFVILGLYVILSLLILAGADRQKFIIIYIFGAFSTWASLAEFIAVKRKIASNALVIAGFTSDVVLVTVGAHFFTMGFNINTDELLIFSLYLITVAATVSASSKITYYCAILASILYPLLLTVEYYGIITPRFVFTNGLFMQIVNIFPGLLALYVLAYIISYLTNNIKKEKQKTEELSGKYQLLYMKTKTSAEQIFEHMADGFLIINEENIIEKSNASAARLLGIKGLTGENVSTIDRKLGVSLLKTFDDLPPNKIVEKELILKHLGIKTLHVSAMKIKLAEHANILVLIIKDITPSWGIVFDSVNKKSIAGAVVRIFDNESGRILASDASDQDGRFEFLATPGKYRITVVKNSYKFPSKISSGYKGEIIEITEKNNDQINVKIPIDSIKIKKNH